MTKKIYTYKVFSNYLGSSRYEHTIVACSRKDAEKYLKSLPTRNSAHYYSIPERGKRYVDNKGI